MMGETCILYRAGQKGSLAQMKQHPVETCSEPEFQGEAGE